MANKKFGSIRKSARELGLQLLPDFTTQRTQPSRIHTAAPKRTSR